MANAEFQRNGWVKELDETNSGFLQMIETFSPQEINRVPFPGSWTAGQVAEHIHKSDEGMIFLLTGPAKREDREPDQFVEKIKEVFLNFNSRLNSPAFIIPQNKSYDKNLLLSRFETERTKITDIIKAFDLSETCTARPFPGFGEITRLEVASFIIYHTQRHLQQLHRIAKKVREKS